MFTFEVTGEDDVADGKVVLALNFLDEEHLSNLTHHHPLTQ